MAFLPYLPHSPQGDCCRVTAADCDHSPCRVAILIDQSHRFPSLHLAFPSSSIDDFHNFQKYNTRRVQEEMFSYTFLISTYE